MAKKNIAVVPQGDMWAVEREGWKLASMHHTQRPAKDAGQRLTKQNQSELVIRQPNGQIRDKDSCGNDHCPPGAAQTRLLRRPASPLPTARDAVIYSSRQ